MDSKIIVRILIVGLTTVLTLISFSESEFLKDALTSFISNKISNKN